MRLLDLFCGAGGASEGYYRSGFDVVGVDIDPQPNYPFKFVLEDALYFLNNVRPGDFDVVHASPPCQSFSAYRRRGGGVGDAYPNLIPAVRAALLRLGVSHVIENVPGAPLRCDWLGCGSAFGLDVRRHRWFETSFPVPALPCRHAEQTPRFPPATNRSNLRRTVEVGVWRIPLATQRLAMGINWMDLGELSQAIPPAYTKHIGHAAAIEIGSTHD